MAFEPENKSNYEWKISVTIFSNRTILSQLAIGIGIPFGILIVMLIIVRDPENLIYTGYAFILLAALFIFTYIIILMMYRGKYEVGFTLSDQGIHCFTLPEQARKNKKINGLTFVLGVLSRKPAIIGAGMIAETKQSVFVNWKDIRKINYHNGQNTILLKGSPTQTIAVFCNPDNFQKVKEIIEAKTQLEIDS